MLALVNAVALFGEHISDVECIEQFGTWLMYADYDRQTRRAAGQSL